MRKIYVLLLLHLFLVPGLMAEENAIGKVNYGLGGGYNLTYSDMYVSGIYFEGLPQFTGDNTSGGYNISLLIDLPAFDLFSAIKGSVRVQLSFNRFSTINHALIAEHSNLVEEPGVNRGEKVYHFDDNFESAISQSGLDVFYKASVSGSKLSLLAGASAGYLFDSHFKQTRTLTDQGQMKFINPSEPHIGPVVTNNGRTVLYSDGEFKGLKKFRFSINLGLCYDFPVFNNIKLSPFVVYNIGLNRLTDNGYVDRWKFNTLQAGINIMTAFGD